MQTGGPVAVPDLNERGLLPVGLHDCTLKEIKERFGTFHRTDRRPKLFQDLENYVKEARATGFFCAIIVNGSFVTSKEYPGDIDIIVVLRAGHELPKELRPFEYNAVSKRRISRRYELDVVLAREGRGELQAWTEHFQQVRGRPALRKGILRVSL